MIEAEVSMNMPIRNSARFTPSRKIAGDCSHSTSTAPIRLGTPARVIR
jgi:hypothetical protein